MQFTDSDSHSHATHSKGCNQCCGSMTFWCGSGSGSADPYLWLIRILLFSSLTFKMPKKNFFFLKSIPAYYFLKVHLHNFSKIKIKKKSQNSRNQGFSEYICLMIEGSGSGSRAGSGSIPLTNGSGSGSRRPKNMWIRWIRIRIWICNFGCNLTTFCKC